MTRTPFEGLRTETKHTIHISRPRGLLSWSIYAVLCAGCGLQPEVGPPKRARSEKVRYFPAGHLGTFAVSEATTESCSGIDWRTLSEKSASVIRVLVVWKPKRGDEHEFVVQTDLTGARSVHAFDVLPALRYLKFKNCQGLSKVEDTLASLRETLLSHVSREYQDVVSDVLREVRRRIHSRSRVSNGDRGPETSCPMPVENPTVGGFPLVLHLVPEQAVASITTDGAHVLTVVGRGRSSQTDQWGTSVYHVTATGKRSLGLKPTATYWHGRRNDNTLLLLAADHGAARVFFLRTLWPHGTAQTLVRWTVPLSEKEQEHDELKKEVVLHNLPSQTEQVWVSSGSLNRGWVFRRTDEGMVAQRYAEGKIHDDMLPVVPELPPAPDDTVLVWSHGQGARADEFVWHHTNHGPWHVYDLSTHDGQPAIVRTAQLSGVRNFFPWTTTATGRHTFVTLPMLDTSEQVPSRVVAPVDDGPTVRRDVTVLRNLWLDVEQFPPLRARVHAANPPYLFSIESKTDTSDTLWLSDLCNTQ